LRSSERQASRWGTTCACLVVLATTLITTPSLPAHAARRSTEVEARRHFKLGEQHFAAARYPEALREYQAGYATASLPGFLVNIGQCHRRMGDLPKARAAFQKFIVAAPASPHRSEVEALIGEIDQVLRDSTGGPAPGGRGVASASQAGTPGASSTASTASLPAAPFPPGNSDVDLNATSPVTGDGRSADPPGSRWWLWTAVASVAVGATVTALAVSSSRPGDPIHDGSIGTLRR